jgi:hypothetical protein
MATDNKYKVGDIVYWKGDRTDRGIIVEIDRDYCYCYRIYWFKTKQCYDDGYYVASMITLLKETPDGN